MRHIIFLNEESGYWTCPHCGIKIHAGKPCPKCDDVEGGRAKGYEPHPHSDRKEKKSSDQISMFDD